jgi:large subunit ribosomal protein L6
MPIQLPKGVQVTIERNNVVVVKGSNGELREKVHPDITVSQEDGRILVGRPTEQKRHKSMHGLYRALIQNMITGVTQGYTRKLELVGVGYRCNASGQQLEVSLGYSHPIVMIIPKEVKVTTETAKGKNPTITLESVDKQLIGQIAAKIRSLRKPEPYKGKGIKYVEEVLRRKAGKTAAATAQ